VKTPAPDNNADPGHYHGASKQDIEAARAAAKTRLLQNRGAHEQLRRNARSGAHKTLSEREVVTAEQLARWAHEDAAHEAAKENGGQNGAVARPDPV
jgi:hypothetical protein